jgi:hypothetical protein
MRRLVLTPLLLLFTCAASHGQTCESIQSQIDLKIKAAGVKNFTLKVADVGSETMGKVVGTCDRGSKKIVYLQNDLATRSSPASQTVPGKALRPVKTDSDAILTECRDGTVTYGGDCKK